MCPVLMEAFPSLIGLKKSPPGAKQNLCFQTLYGGVKFSSNSSLQVQCPELLSTQSVYTHVVMEVPICFCIIPFTYLEAASGKETHHL